MCSLGPDLCQPGFVRRDQTSAGQKILKCALSNSPCRSVRSIERHATCTRTFPLLATQNPIESDGTYPLPRAQIDRFMLKVLVDYGLRGVRLVERMILQPGHPQEVMDAGEPEGLQGGQDRRWRGRPPSVPSSDSDIFTRDPSWSASGPWLVA